MLDAKPQASNVNFKTMGIVDWNMREKMANA